jgi:hypothetical protein
MVLVSATAHADLLTGLVGNWSFNYGDARDETGNGNNGTVYGAVLAADRFGNLNSAYSFDGVNDYISIPHDNAFNGTNALRFLFGSTLMSFTLPQM